VFQRGDEVVRMRGARGRLDLRLRVAAAHVDVFARRGGQQEGVLRHQAHVGAEAFIVDAVEGDAIDGDAALGDGVKAQQQGQQSRLAAARVADDAKKSALRNAQRQLVQHGLVFHVGKRQAGNVDGGHVAARFRLPQGRCLPALRVFQRLRFVEQGRHARRRHHRLLQLAELHGDLDQGFDHARDVADERIQHAHFHGAHVAAAEAEDDDGQQHDVEHVERGAQQPGVGAQFLHARRVVVLVDAREAGAEALFRVIRLQHAHAAYRFGDLPVDFAAQGARARDGRRAPALVQKDDEQHGRQQRQHDQHQAPVEEGHGGHGADQDDGAVEDDEQHLHVQRFHRLRVVGDAADQLARDGAIKKTHRQAQHVLVHGFAQALHRAHGQAGQAHQLQIAQAGRDPARQQAAAQQQGHARPVQVARQQVLVDQGLAQDRPRHFQGGGEDQPERGPV